MLVIRVLARFDPERRQEALDQLAREAVEVPVRFAGCQHFRTFVDPADPDQVLIYEEWADQAAFDAYRSSDYFTEGGKVLFPAMAGAPDSAYYAAELRRPVTAAKRTASKRSRSPRLDDAIAFRIHRTNRFLRTTLTRMLQEHGDGITPEQFFVLWRLREEAPRRQVDLTEPVLGDPPNVARLVDALSHRGFVERRADPDDRRSWQVHLTPAGTALMKRLEPVVVGERTSLSAGLDDAQLDQLVAALDVIDANLRARLVR